MRKDRYSLDNIPIRDEVKKRLEEGNLSDLPAIDLLHSIGRMLTLQDNAYEEQFEEVTKTLSLIHKAINRLSNKIGRLDEKLEDVIEINELKETG